MAELEKQLAEAERTRLAGEAKRAELEARLAGTATPSAMRQASVSDGDASGEDEMPAEFSVGGRTPQPRFPPSPTGVWYSVHDFDGELYYCAAGAPRTATRFCEEPCEVSATQLSGAWLALQGTRRRARRRGRCLRRRW
eukprot:2155564-Prymnesium_polylepis.2